MSKSNKFSPEVRERGGDGAGAPRGVLDAVGGPRVDRLLPAVRQVVGEAADERMDQQPAGEQARVDDFGDGWLLRQHLP